MSLGYGAIAAASGASVAHDDKGRCATRIAFALVGALGFLTHCVQVEVGQHVLHRAYPGIGPQGNGQPAGAVCSQACAGRKIKFMGKDTNFIGQPIFGQLLNFLDKGHIKRVSRELEADKYVKKFTSYKHVVVMLFAVFEGYHSIRDTVLGLLSHASKLQHLGLDYIVRRSTLSDANARRPNELFAKVYYETYSRYKDILSDSNLSKKRWQIELLLKQLKQNFPLKYFLGDNENAIIIQI